VDSGNPQLQDTIDFKLTVIPAIPANLRLDGVGSEYKRIMWDAVEYATGYILERKDGTGDWTPVTNTSKLEFCAFAWYPFEVSFRVRAYNNQGELSPFSLPLSEYFSETLGSSGVFTSFAVGGPKVNWFPTTYPNIDPADYQRLVDWLNKHGDAEIAERESKEARSKEDEKQ
jgi:hypothetical protein